MDKMLANPVLKPGTIKLGHMTAASHCLQGLSGARSAPNTQLVCELEGRILSSAEIKIDIFDDASASCLFITSHLSLREIEEERKVFPSPDLNLYHGRRRQPINIQ